MTTARADIVSGPAIVTFDSQVFYTAGDIILRAVKGISPISTSMHGEVAQIFDSLMWELQFTPAGQWLAAHLPVLWPYTNPTRGSSIFGATDKDIVIQTLAGQQITLSAGAVTQMPELTLSAAGPVIGQVTMEAVGKTGVAWTDSAKRAVVATQAFADTSFDPADILVCAYSVAWGSSPWDAFDTEAGVRVQFNTDLREERTDTEGIVDKRMNGVTVQARFVPVGITEAQWLTKAAMQDTGIQRGARITNTDSLIITGGSDNPIVTLYYASIVDGSLVFGEPKRVGEIVVQCVRRFTTGAAQALFAVAVGA
jgi:hypothetical protein